MKESQMTESHKNELCTYSLGNVGELYDYTAIEEITGLNKTKLHRVMVKECLKPAHIYKNKHLFGEEEVMKAMEVILIERLMKIWRETGHKEPITEQ
jgi:hypothetical protein